MFKLPKVPILLPLANLWSKHDRTILTIGAVGGVLTSVAIAIRDRPKYENILWECEDDDCTKLEAAKRLMPATIPLMISTGTTLFLILWNHYRSGKKITELTDKASSAINAYMVGKAIHDEYKEKYGPEVDDEMSRKAAEKRAASSWKSASDNPNAIIATGHGDDLIYDEWSGTFFYSKWNHVEKCVNAADDKVRSEMWVEVEEIYRDWGWPSNKIPSCAKMGWNVDDGRIQIYSPECEFNEDIGKPYSIVRFVNKPGYPYERKDKGWR